MRDIAREVRCQDCGHQKIGKGFTEGGRQWWMTGARFCDKCDGVVVPVPDPQGEEKLGERCIDGGKCHHDCKDKCFRRDCCAPLSGYTGPWKYEQPASPRTTVPLSQRVRAGIEVAPWVIEEIRRLESVVQPPAAQPVAWCVAYDDPRMGRIHSNPTMNKPQAQGMIAMAVGRKLTLVDLYAMPDPRIAELEGLLREVLSDCYTMMRDNGYTASLLERIKAALNKEG